MNKLQIISDILLIQKQYIENKNNFPYSSNNVILYRNENFKECINLIIQDSSFNIVFCDFHIDGIFHYIESCVKQIKNL